MFKDILVYYFLPISIPFIILPFLTVELKFGGGLMLMGAVFIFFGGLKAKPIPLKNTYISGKEAIFFGVLWIVAGLAAMICGGS